MSDIYFVISKIVPYRTWHCFRIIWTGLTECAKVFTRHCSVLNFLCEKSVPLCAGHGRQAQYIRGHDSNLNSNIHSFWALLSDCLATRYQWSFPAKLLVGHSISSCVVSLPHFSESLKSKHDTAKPKLWRLDIIQTADRGSAPVTNSLASAYFNFGIIIYANYVTSKKASFLWEVVFFASWASFKKYLAVFWPNNPFNPV